MEIRNKHIHMKRKSRKMVSFLGISCTEDLNAKEIFSAKDANEASKTSLFCLVKGVRPVKGTFCHHFDLSLPFKDGLIPYLQMSD